MPLILNTLLLLGELWLLAGLVLTLHRLSPNIGLAPILILLGALTAAMQFNSMGLLFAEFAGITIRFTLVSFILLPVILLGLLVIYIINGTIYARSVILGLGLVTAAIALYQAVPIKNTANSWLNLVFVKEVGFSPYLLITSMIVLLVDFIVLMVVYQAVSNLQKRFPSRIAGMTALLTSVLVDAVLFPVLNYAGQPVLSSTLVIHVTGKLFSTLLLSPLLFSYLKRVALTFPDTAADMPRPALDLFTTTVQLEARNRYQFNLLRILTHVNQLILRADDLDDLLEQTCHFLTDGKEYDLTWIKLPGKDFTSIKHQGIQSQAGKEMLDQLSSGGQTGLQQSQAQVYLNLARGELPEWAVVFKRLGYHSAGVFPLRHTNQHVGSLVIASRQPGKFQAQEVNLLQELADDLAYALVNLDYQKQQTILRAGAQNMQDGLMITDTHGEIVFVNPAGAAISVLPYDQITGKNIRDSVLSETTLRIFETYLPRLLKRGQISGEMENIDRDGKVTHFAMRASVVKDIQGRVKHLVFNFQDTTLRRHYEHQLLTLNHIVNELVQIYDINELMQSLLKAAEELLGADASGIFITSPDKRITRTITSNLSEEYASRIGTSYPGLPEETVLTTRQLVAIEDVLTDDTYGEHIHFIAGYGISSVLVLPVSFHDQLIGILAIYYKRPHRYTDQELQLGLTLAHTLAIAHQNARLYQSEHSQRTLAEALAQAAAALNTSLDLDQVLDQILDQTLRVANCRSVNIMMFDEKIAYTVQRRETDEPDKVKGELNIRKVPLAIPTFDHMLATKTPILIGDTENDERWTKGVGNEKIKSYAGAPLLIDQQVVGFINIDSLQPNFFSEETTRRLEAFASYAATAIQNARLFQRLQQYANNLEDRVKERTVELQEAKQFIEGILRSVPDAVYVLNEHSEVVQANHSGEVLLSLARQQELNLFNPQFLDHVFDRSKPAEKNIIEVQGRSYQPLASELTMVGAPVGKVLVFRDVTGFRELDKMKTQFVSDVSHELRTPLTNMTIYLDLLQNISDESKRQLYLDTLRRETGRLTHLIEDLLTISRLEAGRVEIYLKPTNLNRLISELANDRTIMANSRELVLSCEPAIDLPLAMADARLLNQAISNLLTNAINYTPPGGVICLQTQLRQEEKTAWILIHVIDNGVGITPEELEHIFERFYRGTASYHTKASGTGLGLPISKEIIERMGGRMTVESTPKIGSTFTVWLRAVL